MTQASQGLFQTWSDEIQSLSSDEAAAELAHKIIETVSYGDEDQSVIVMGAFSSFSDKYLQMTIDWMLRCEDCRVQGYAMLHEPTIFHEKSKTVRVYSFGSGLLA